MQDGLSVTPVEPEQPTRPQGNPRRGLAIGGGIVALLMVVAYFQITIFVVQPIGAVPNGVTAILWRRSAMLNFVDSADAMCEREMGGVSLLCRMAALGGTLNNNPVLLRLPYMPWLYSLSTRGREYGR